MLDDTTLLHQNHPDRVVHSYHQVRSEEKENAYDCKVTQLDGNVCLPIR